MCNEIIDRDARKGGKRERRGKKGEEKTTRKRHFKIFRREGRGGVETESAEFFHFSLPPFLHPLLALSSTLIKSIGRNPPPPQITTVAGVVENYPLRSLYPLPHPLLQRCRTQRHAYISSGWRSTRAWAFTPILVAHSTHTPSNGYPRVKSLPSSFFFSSFFSAPFRLFPSDSTLS